MSEPAQVVSFRMDPDMLAELRDIANQQGCTVSDLLRRGVLMALEEPNWMVLTWTSPPAQSATTNASGSVALGEHPPETPMSDRPMTLQDVADKLEAGFQRLTVAFKDAIGIPTVDASAPADPGEGHRTGTGGPDAPGASEGLDAAIEAAYNAITDADPWFGTDQDHWRHAGLAVRAAEPILRQAVAEEIAKTAEQWAADTIDMRAAPAYQAMADVARIIGKRGAKP